MPPQLGDALPFGIGYEVDRKENQLPSRKNLLTIELIHFKTGGRFNLKHPHVNLNYQLANQNRLALHTYAGVFASSA